MCDQLTSVGVEFDLASTQALFLSSLRWSAAHPFPYLPSPPKDDPIPWGNQDIFPSSLSSIPREGKDDSNDPGTNNIDTLWETARPWSLGQTRSPTSWLQKAMGESVRRPGLFMRTSEDTNAPMDEPLVNTGEAVHSSVRVRLACGGLGMDDDGVWGCKALGEWELRRHGQENVSSFDGAVGVVEEAYPTEELEGGWSWYYRQSSEDGEVHSSVPQVQPLPEAPLVGPYERLLLALTRGQQDVWKYAAEKDHI